MPNESVCTVLSSSKRTFTQYSVNFPDTGRIRLDRHSRPVSLPADASFPSRPHTKYSGRCHGGLNGKVTLVTGASSGIGESTAEALAEMGASVVLVALMAISLHGFVQSVGDILL